MRLSPSILAVVAVAVSGCTTLRAPHAAPAAPAAPAAVLDAPAASSSPAAEAPVVGMPAGDAVPPAAPHDTALPQVVLAGVPTAPVPDAPAGASASASALTSVVPDVSAREVTRQAISVFGDSLASAPALPATPADEPTWDMDVRSYETQDRVAHYVSMFTGRGKSRITERLAKGTRYEPMIRAKFKAGGLPEDMYYLALIESGFDPNAYSRAAAVGMWQFMTSTGRGMGMRIDWWVDERRDPVKSTIAAVRFIRGLRDQFGSLYLAAAAYNGGPGRVARGLAKYSDDLENTLQAEDAFFVLAEKDYLRNETREYVPQLIAAALIAKEPVRYGMTLSPLPAFAYDSVRVPGGTPLAAVARASGTTVAVIRELNPHVLRGMTPPGDRLLLRVPVGAADAFSEALSALPKADRVGLHTVVSRKGETADHLAEANGVPVAALEAFNTHLRRLKPSGRLVPGQSIVLPTPAVAAAATHVPDPSIEKYGRSSTGRLRTHTVRHGETVRMIARKYRTTPDRLMRLNHLRKPMIFAGQDLIVAGTPRSGTPRSAAHAERTGRSAPAHRPAAAGTAKGRHGKAPPRGAKSVKRGKAASRPAAGKHSGAGSKAGAR